MSAQFPLPIHRYQGGELQPTVRPLVAEYPLHLTVNERPLATLIASPHQLNFLVIGFLKLQGMIDTLEDIRCLGVCTEQGAARVEIRGETPQGLRPTLTSGCGTGISFDLELRGAARQPQPEAYPAEAVLALMRQLARRAELYGRHGGLHSAAVGNASGLLLHAEDLGRHNTLDRIAGEALFRGLDLHGCMLVSSGRISTEMVAKSARLGIGLIASRTSPTEAAVRLARQAGITLIGYLRGETFEVYTHPAQLALPNAAWLIPHTSGVILAGGESRRMGSDKSLLALAGERFIERSYQLMASLFEEVLIVTNSPELYADIPCRKVPDLYRGQGALAGIHSGLQHASQPQIFVVACDMPFLQPELIRHLCAEIGQADVHIPRTDSGLEPLHSCYRKSCLTAIETLLQNNGRRITDFFPALRVTELCAEACKKFDTEGRSFHNINTPQDYFSLRETSPSRHQTKPLPGTPASSHPRKLPVPAISFIARSGTGKTTLLEKVIAIFKARGFRVGVVKHDAHRFEIDHPGKDSYRLTAAGADTMLISSQAKLALVKQQDQTPELDELLTSYFSDVDLVLIEGFKLSGLPKIEVHRPAHSEAYICIGEQTDPSLMAVASDQPLELEVPLLDLNDPATIVDFIISTVLSTSETKVPANVQR
ncbi:molybdopterin-guanine dinucleotide biosynthesis protein B [Geopsychrobacter electrodiphilus]|uniref:molybdopterin-guanine dinucleotide biosynthesis protein B n=1 Tax=Geopsychrobacter electrodiphilus TaxID=225196 RepID=UPI00036EEF64|nr:molybdopterin-guanine dinucleotide biosynthesis protein B [Geopsychrobacter electrodiphilus]